MAEFGIIAPLGSAVPLDVNSMKCDIIRRRCGTDI